jgi:hypothetical protein
MKKLKYTLKFQKKILELIYQLTKINHQLY